MSFLPGIIYLLARKAETGYALAATIAGRRAEVLLLGDADIKMPALLLGDADIPCLL